MYVDFSGIVCMSLLMVVIVEVAVDCWTAHQREGQTRNPGCVEKAMVRLE